MDKFDYISALDRLERIAVTVEDPGTCLDDVDKYVSEAGELIEKCRAYLRQARESADSLDR